MKKLYLVLIIFLCGSTYNVGPDETYKSITKLPPLKSDDSFTVKSIEKECPLGMRLSCAVKSKPVKSIITVQWKDFVRSPTKYKSLSKVYDITIIDGNYKYYLRQ